MTTTRQAISVDSRILSVIGVGDGGWGAFYDVSSLYVLRTTLFGFVDSLQLIQGKLSSNGYPTAFVEVPEDSLGQAIDKPSFLGVQSLAECLFYDPAILWNGESMSLYEAVKQGRRTGDRKHGVHLYAHSGVRPLEKLQREPRGPTRLVSEKVNDVYDHIVVTAQPWSLQVESGF